MKIMGVKLRMTAAHRAQADGQVKRQNRVLEDSLRRMTSDHGNEWADLLGTIEYAHSTLVSASTQLSPFQIDAGRVPHHPDASTPMTHARRAVPKAEYARQFAEHRRGIVEHAEQTLLDAKRKQKQCYDRKRAEPDFKAGDLVLLKTEILTLKHVAQSTELTKAKLKARSAGSFMIEYMVNGNVARLKLPRQLRGIHPSFNVGLLDHYPEQHERFRSQPQSKATPVELEDEAPDSGMRIIERLLAKRKFNRQLEYLVKWLGEPEAEGAWERERDIRHVVHWASLIKELRVQQGAKGTSSRGDCRQSRRSESSRHDLTHDAGLDESHFDDAQRHALSRPDESHSDDSWCYVPSRFDESQRDDARTHETTPVAHSSTHRLHQARARAERHTEGRERGVPMPRATRETGGGKRTTASSPSAMMSRVSRAATRGSVPAHHGMLTRAAARREERNR
jgi:hypothetical protein